MKKQITTVAAMVIASNAAMAGVSQQSVKLSNDSINSIVQASEVLSQGTVQLVKGSAKVGSEVSEVSFKRLLELASDTAASTSRVAGRVYDESIDSGKSASGKVSGVAVKIADGTVASAKSTSAKASAVANKVADESTALAKSASQGLSNAAEFTVEKAEIIASASATVVSATLKSVNGHVMMGLKFTYNISQSFGKGMVEAATDVLKTGRKVIVAASNSGVVLVTDSANGIENVLNGDIKGGSSTIIGSFAHASKAFGSKLVD